MGDNDNRSARIQVPNVSRNCTMMDDNVPATLRITRIPSNPDATPSNAPPGTAMSSRGSSPLDALPGNTAAGERQHGRIGHAQAPRGFQQHHGNGQQNQGAFEQRHKTS